MRLGSVLGWFQETAFWRWFSRKVLPFVNVRLWGYPALDMETYFKVRSAMQNYPESVYVFVGVNKCALSYRINRLITGAQWSHAGVLYLDDRKEVRMRHMVNSGFEDWSLMNYLREIDDFCLMELPLPEHNLSTAKRRLERLWDQEDSIGYDFNFQLTEDVVQKIDSSESFQCPTLYCSELVWLLAYGLVEGPSFRPRWTLDRKVFEPDDVWRGCKEVVLTA